MLKQGKSKKSLDENMSTEMDAGKPKKQALAIAYSVQRKNKRKMSRGGEVRAATVRPDTETAADEREERMLEDHATRHEAEMRAASMRASADDAEDDRDEEMMAEGGMVPPSSMDLADRIRERMKMRRFAEGGQVDLEENAEEHDNMEDDLSFDALRKENYSESDALDNMDSPRDSNLHDRDLKDEDEHERSMLDEIRRSMKMRRR